MKRNIFLFMFFGALSGCLSFWSFASSERSGIYEYVLIYGPGWIFGLTISSLLYFLFRKNIFFHFIYVAISTVAFYLAMRSVFWFDDNNSGLGFFVAGMIGSFVLMLGLKLIYTIPIQYIVFVVLVGGVVASLDADLGIFPIWQTVVATAIGFAMNESVKFSAAPST